MDVKLIFALFLLHSGVLIQAEDPSTEEAKPKPFGIGVGKTFIGGRDTDNEGTQIALTIYSQYLQYQRIVGNVDEAYYNSFTKADKCQGHCQGYSKCQDGICICEEEYLQNYGRCFYGSTAAVHDTNKNKFRMPEPPPLADWCWCTRDVRKSDRDGKTKLVTEKFVCEQHAHKEECIKKIIPAEFNHEMQFCSPNAHNTCKQKDINMYCSDEKGIDPEDGVQKNFCRCTQGTKFDTKNMECRIFLDVDCTYTEKIDITKIEDGDDINKKALREVIYALNSTDPIDTRFDAHLANQAFCNLIDSEAEAYTEHAVGDLTLYGLSIGGFILAVFATCCAACCCCQCCASVREKIRRLDPRYVMRQRLAAQNAQNGGGGGGGMPTTEMAALGAIAAGEYMAGQKEQNNEAAVAAMQGVPGYAPVPQGYPQGGAPPYMAGGQPPQGPYPGYAPVPQGQGIMGMAPELALAGAGAWTGNNTMAAMGVAAAMEKVGQDEDDADRLRAGAIQNVPPPMGYPGGAAPGNWQPNMPPSNANYPRM